MAPDAAPRPRRALEPLALTAISAAALTLHWRAWEGTGLWRDAAQMVDVATLPTVRDVLSFLGTSESHPPLYYLVLRGWIALTGGGDDALWALGTILGLVTPWLAWALLRRTAGAAPAMAAAALIAIAPAMLVHSVMVRPYAWLALLLLLALAAVRRLVESPGAGTLVPVVLAGTAALYTHNWAALPLAALLLGALVEASRRGARARTAVIAAGSLTLLAWAPWLPVLRTQVAHAGYGPATLSWTDVRWALPAVTGQPWSAGAMALVLPLLTVTLLLARRGAPASVDAGADLLRRLAWWTVLGAAALAVLLSPLSNLLIWWPLSTLAPLFFVGVAAELGRHRIGGRRLALAAGVFLGVVTAVLHDAVLLRQPAANTRATARHVAANAAPDDLVLLEPVYLAPSFLRYAPPTLDVRTMPPEARPRPIAYVRRTAADTDAAREQSLLRLVGDARRDGRRIWLVRMQRAAWVGDGMARRVDSALVRAYGPPAAADTSSVGDRWLESVSWYRFEPRSTVGRFAPPETARDDAP